MRSPTPLLPVLLAILGAAAPGAALASLSTNRTVRIEALVDGRSQLRLSGATAQWFHIDAAAPGRHEFRNEPTVLDGTPWFPAWPDVPNAENRDCRCLSSVYSGLVPPLPLAEGRVELRVLQARWAPSVVESPTAANGYTLVVELDDRGFNGSAWYVLEIDLATERYPFSSFTVGSLDLSVSGEPGSPGGYTLAGEFELAPEGDGIDPLGEAVVVTVGAALVTIPPGSFVSSGPGFIFDGAADGIAVSAAISEIAAPRYAFAIRARQLEIERVSAREAVTLAIGDDAGTAAVPLAGILRYRGR